jgi:predicted lactoylglutathione lyase
VIAYTTVGTNNMAKSAAFYDALLAEVGGNRIMEIDRVILWGSAEGAPLFCVAEPENGAPATVGNGCMIVLSASSTGEVDRPHAKAIELGAKDEGTLGPRENKDLKFYAGYFRDPEGNKLNLFHM